MVQTTIGFRHIADYGDPVCGECGEGVDVKLARRKDDGLVDLSFSCSACGTSAIFALTRTRST